MLVYTAPLSITQHLAAGLGAGPSGQAWVLSSMSLGLTVAMLTTGALGDDLGRRRVFVLGAAALALGCVVCAAAPETWSFVAGRVLSGVGAAALVACSLALIGHAVPPGGERARAMGMWGAYLGAGISAGPVLAALAAEDLQWRWVYVLFTVLAVALVPAGRALLTESTSGRTRNVDLTGVALLAAGISCLLAGGRSGWSRPVVLVLLAAGVVLLAGFLVAQLRGRAPMIDLGLFRRPALISATLAALVVGAGVIAVMSFLPTMAQRGWGGSALYGALLLLTWSGPSVLTALGARHLGSRLPGGVRLGIGLLITAAGLVVMIDAPVLGLLIAGVGSGITNTMLGAEAVASVPAADAGAGSGINNTARYLGAAIGVTVVSVLSGPTLDGWNLALLVGAAVSVVGAVGCVLLSAQRRALQTT